MLIKFESSVAANILMRISDAHKILKIIKKDYSENEGIITVEQIPDTIITLQSAFKSEDCPGDTEEEFESNISLSQRAWPLLRMLEDSLKNKKPVIWKTV